MEKTNLTAYLAVEEFLPLLQKELKDKTVKAVFDRLILTEGSPKTVYWAQNIWYGAEEIKISSIGDAVKKLKARQRNWWPYSFQLHRRTNLIQEQLPTVKINPLSFPAAALAAPLGSYCLLDEHTMLVAEKCSSRFPNGEPIFHEQKIGPPSRAYLKIWEALTRLGKMPGPGEQCLELGASPGGWTWVIGSLGAKVIAIDRAPLAPNVSALTTVVFREGDAFQATPEKIGEIDWLFSDLICYPEKLFDFVMLWLNSGKCRNAICTLKFQGSEHYEVIRDFAAIPGSTLIHLAANKHELTWIYTGNTIQLA